MTEAEWLHCTEPTPMLEFLAGKASDRKLRLFAVACCRNIWNLVSSEFSRKALEASEEYADGRVRRKQLMELRERARQNESDHAQFAVMAASRAKIAPSWVALLAAHARDQSGITSYAPSPKSSSEQCVHLRDLFGPFPFRPISLDPSILVLNDGTIHKLAQAIYEQRAFDRLPILADALEQAGCANADILTHCRHPGPHVRGCWVVDLILGKE